MNNNEGISEFCSPGWALVHFGERALEESHPRILRWGITTIYRSYNAKQARTIQQTCFSISDTFRAVMLLVENRVILRQMPEIYL